MVADRLEFRTNEVGETWLVSEKWANEVQVSRELLFEQQHATFITEWVGTATPIPKSFAIAVKNGWAIYDVTGRHEKLFDIWIGKLRECAGPFDVEFESPVVEDSRVEEYRTLRGRL